MYLKRMFVFDREQKPHRAVIRNYQYGDFGELIEIQKECFPPPFPSELWWNEQQLRNHVDIFPDGALCVEIEGRLAGSVTGLVVSFDDTRPDHTWSEMTDNGYIRNHRPDGNTLYIVDISVRPAFRKWGLGKILMQAMYETVVQLGLDRLLGGGRMSGYHRYADNMTAEQYLQEVVSGHLHDPVITFMLRCGRTPLSVIADYLEDEESRNYGVLMEWKNPFRQFPGK